MLYRPSLVANLTLRFDESLLVQAVEVASVDQRVRTPGAPSSGASVRPLVTSKGRDSFIANRVPKSATIELPGYRQAGTFSLTMDFRELPIDPRTIRAASVELHLGTVSAEKFAQGMALPPRMGNNKPSILDTRGTLLGNDTLIMIGLVDEWDARHGSSGSEVTLSGRDLRGVLLDTPISVEPKATAHLLSSIDVSKPIDQVVRQILKFHPLFERMNVVVNLGEWGASGVPAPGHPSILPRHKKGAKGNKGAAAPSAETSKTTFWDLIVQFCYFVGAVPLLKGADLIIRPVRRLYDQQNAGIDPAIGAPFAGQAQRTVDAATGAQIGPLSVRRMVYGRDTDDLRIQRKFSGYMRPRIVRVIGTDDSAPVRGKARMLIARWPPEDAKKAKATKAGQDKMHEDIITVPVAGIRDTTRLTEIARSIYEEMGRGEVGGTVVTKNLASFGGDNADPDLLRLKPGDAVEIGVDTRAVQTFSPLVSELTDHMRTPFQARVDELAKLLGGDQNLAAAIVATSRGQVQSLQRFFRVSSVRYSWTSKAGVQISFDFQNYIESRARADDDAPGAASMRRQAT